MKEESVKLLCDDSIHKIFDDEDWNNMFWSNTKNVKVSSNCCCHNRPIGMIPVCTELLMRCDDISKNKLKLKLKE